MRSPGASRRLVAGALAMLAFGCSSELTEEKARIAADEAQQATQPLDAGAMEQDLDAETILEVQEQLTTLKEYMGPVNGKLDQVTLNALEAFQRSQNITADGRFNEKTLTALAAASKERD